MTHESYPWKRFFVVLAAVLAAYWAGERLGLFRFSPGVGEGTGLFAVFLIGLIAAFSSCTAVVGGLVVAVAANAAKKYPDAPFAVRIRPHLSFNAGRVLGFAIFGALIGLLGQAVSLSTTANGIFVLLVALLMLGIGGRLLDLAPRWAAVKPPEWLAERIKALRESDHPLMPALLGALTFFLPCGFTQSVQLYALSLGDPAAAAATMMVFALGTMPALLGVGAFASAVKGRTLRRFTIAVGVFVAALALANLRSGLALMGVIVPDTAGVEGSSQAENGVQVVRMEVTPYGVYEPDVLRVPAGQPIRWEIIGTKNMGCADTLVSRSLGVNLALRVGTNVVNIPPLTAGRYAFSCGMGMVRGTLIAE